MRARISLSFSIFSSHVIVASLATLIITKPNGTLHDSYVAVARCNYCHLDRWPFHICRADYGTRSLTTQLTSARALFLRTIRAKRPARTFAVARAIVPLDSVIIFVDEFRIIIITQRRMKRKQCQKLRLLDCSVMCLHKRAIIRTRMRKKFHLLHAQIWRDATMTKWNQFE